MSELARVVVLLSGGADSVCLLHRTVAEHGPENVLALHVNYGLRQEADADEAFCRDLCERLGVRCEVVRAGPPPATGNLQAWARERRYAEAERLARAHDAEVATGHTASDQVETVLYRLASSPGRRALLGMPAREGRLVRPLLAWSRADTRAYCERHGLPWREDASNDSAEFARNRVRHGLVAALRDVHPAAETNVLRTLALLRDEAEVLERLVDEVVTDSLAELRALPAALRRLVLQRLAGPEAPAVSARAEEILSLTAEGSASLDLGGGWRAIVEYGRLRFHRAGRSAAGLRPGASGSEAPAPALLEVPGEVAFGSGVVRAESGAELPVADGTLDAATLAPPLEIRAWREGDRMRPLGLGGSKSLQDLFTDRKIPRERRARLPVVLSEGEIAWVPGVATGDAFKVTSATRERVRLAWRA